MQALSGLIAHNGPGSQAVLAPILQMGRERCGKAKDSAGKSRVVSTEGWTDSKACSSFQGAQGAMGEQGQRAEFK